MSFEVFLQADGSRALKLAKDALPNQQNDVIEGDDVTFRPRTRRRGSALPILVVLIIQLAACSASTRERTSIPGASPTPSDCPSLDVTLSDLIGIGRVKARECFADSQITLRGWVWEDRGAYDCVADWAVPGDPLPPDWLYCAATKHARLTKVPYLPGEPLPGYIRAEDGPFYVAVDPASPAAGLLLPNGWVEVIGRFNDPVIGQCELVGDPTFREECMSTFVVLEARAIEAP